MPQNYYFGGGPDSSIITPIAVLGLTTAIVLMLALRPKRVLIPMLSACLLIPFGTNLVVLGLHFPTMRLLLAAGWIRVIIRRDLTLGRLNSLDKALLLWALSNAIAFSITWGTLAAMTNRLAFLWDTLGAYFLARMLARDKEDVILAIKTIAILFMLIAPAMAIEHINGHNLFSVLGAAELSDVRYGSVRAKGPFGHAIIAGTIAAMSMPLFVGLWWQRRPSRMFLGFAVLSSAIMVITSASSTPLMTLVTSSVGLLLWPVRNYMRMFRWGLSLMILSLHLVMKAPVWMLIARTGGAIGGSGDHRAMLIDNFIRHFGEWCVFGTRNNADWGYDMWDVDNAFVAAGIGGGLVAFVAFIAILVCAYRQVGIARKAAGRPRNDQRLIWAIGASLFANNVGFFGIVYFDQSVLIWYLLLAIVSATAAFPLNISKPSESRLAFSQFAEPVADMGAFQGYGRDERTVQ